MFAFRWAVLCGVVLPLTACAAPAKPLVQPPQTAVPAFIGYTALHRAGGRVVAARVESLAEFERRFGGGDSRFVVQVSRDGAIAVHRAQGAPAFRLHDAIHAYFAEGGGPCHVVSIGDHDAAPARGDFEKGLDAAAGIADVTLLAMPEAVRLADAGPKGRDEYHAVCRAALAQCGRLRNRLAILDVLDDADGPAHFRAGIGADHLRFGAAYTPFIRVALQPFIRDELVEVRFEQDPGAVPLSRLERASPRVFKQIKVELANATRTTLPPSTAVAGAFAKTDREHGVWKAPAGTSFASAVEVTQRLPDAALQALAVPTDGKSICGIRELPGRGIAIWGARTLDAGNADGRYISVQRTAMHLEQTLRLIAAAHARAGNNDATWKTVRDEFEAYLLKLWREGGMQGSKPQEAFYVKAGLGTTMTPLDIEHGRMIVEAGFAATRPAEFVVVRVVHAMGTP